MKGLYPRFEDTGLSFSPEVVIEDGTSETRIGSSIDADGIYRGAAHIMKPPPLGAMKSRIKVVRNAGDATDINHLANLLKIAAEIAHKYDEMHDADNEVADREAEDWGDPGEDDGCDYRSENLRETSVDLCVCGHTRAAHSLSGVQCCSCQSFERQPEGVMTHLGPSAAEEADLPRRASRAKEGDVLFSTFSFLVLDPNGVEYIQPVIAFDVDSARANLAATLGTHFPRNVIVGPATKSDLERIEKRRQERFAEIRAERQRKVDEDNRLNRRIERKEDNI